MTTVLNKQSTKDGVFDGLKRALGEYKIAALTKREGKVLFDYVENVKDIEQEYTPTVLSPKKFFFPQEEVILEYTFDGKVTAKTNPEKIVLFGVRPCDISGMKILDEAFSESHGDPNYLSKRENSVIIGIDCKSVCDEDAFCYRVNSQNPESGFDIMLHDIGNDYSMTIVSDKGKDFAGKYFDSDLLDYAAFAKFNIEKKEAFAKAGGPWADLDNLPEIFEENTNHKIWETEAERCLSCGSCIMVCPTCYCFDVIDELALSMKVGDRLRRWDACMLRSFAEVAGDENFREEVENRVKHRINRKFNFLMKKHNQSVCIGCGRCVRACLAEISPVTIVEELTKTSRALKLEERNDALYLPEKVTITKVEQFTENEKFFEVEFNNGRSLDHDPGQFVQLSILGIGEAAISVSSPPSFGNRFEMVVRTVGDVTSKLHTLGTGDHLFIRGPFGHGFDEKIQKEMEGKHILYIAGGIGYVPLRSLINLTLKHPEKYKKISILYGCRTQEDQMYKDELKYISELGGNIELLETVDVGNDKWLKNTGVITDLIPVVKFDHLNTVAIICGPPVMYKFVIQTLKRHKLTTDNMFVSLERRMKCGVGKCGHCQIDDIYVCQTGPVYRFSDIEDKEEAL